MGTLSLIIKKGEIQRNPDHMHQLKVSVHFPGFTLTQPKETAEVRGLDFEQHIDKSHTHTHTHARTHTDRNTVTHVRTHTYTKRETLIDC